MTLKATGIVAGYLAAGVVAGTLTALWLGRGELSPTADSGALPAAADSALEQRFLVLRTDVDRRLNAIEGQLAELAISLQASGSGSRAEQEALFFSDAEPAPEPQQAMATASLASMLTPQILSASDATERLVSAGFTPDRAEWLIRRSEELRLDHARLQYEGQHQGPRNTPAAGGEVYQRIVDPDSVLRDEIDDAEYERFLSGLGRPTSVTINRVLSGSAAEQAGLQAGDEIVSYGGQRVFNVADLNARSMDAPPGQTIFVNVLRDGLLMQVVLPGGPVGIDSPSRPSHFIR